MRLKQHLSQLTERIINNFKTYNVHNVLEFGIITFIQKYIAAKTCLCLLSTDVMVPSVFMKDVCVVHVIIQSAENATIFEISCTHACAFTSGLGN